MQNHFKLLFSVLIDMKICLKQLSDALCQGFLHYRFQNRHVAILIMLWKELWKILIISLILQQKCEVRYSIYFLKSFTLWNKIWKKREKIGRKRCQVERLNKKRGKILLMNSKVWCFFKCCSDVFCENQIVKNSKRKVM